MVFVTKFVRLLAKTLRSNFCKVSNKQGLQLDGTANYKNNI